MAFDLSSAKEVPPQSGGFDLSSAKEVPLMDRLSTGAAQGFAEVGNLADTYGTLAGTGVQEAWRHLGKLAGSKREYNYDERFDELNKRIKDRRDWANPEQLDVGIAGSIAGGLTGLPGMILAPVSGLGVAKDFMDKGESGTRGAVAGLTDSALSTAGVFIPGLGKTIPGKLAMGGAVNSGQGAISDAVANAIAQKQETKDAYQWDDVNRRVAEAVIGAGAGLMTPTRKPAAKPAPKDFNALVEAEKRASAKPVEQSTMNPADAMWRDRAQQIQEQQKQFLNNEQVELIEAQMEIDRQTRGHSGQLELFDQPEQGRIANPYEAKTGDWRVDENGIPIKADLSMDVQNAAQPLQRNLWGDELQRTRNPIGMHGTLEDAVRQHQEGATQEGVPLSEAIDSIPDTPFRGDARDQALGQLTGDVEPSGHLLGSMADARRRGGNQNGSFDYELLPKAFRDFVDNWKNAGGNLSHVGVSRMLDDHPVSLNPMTRETLNQLYPATAKEYQAKIDKAIANSDLDKARRWGKHYDDALITEAVLKQHDAFGKGFTLDGPRYDAKTGRYAGKVAAQEQADAAVNIARRGGKQSGAVDFQTILDLFPGFKNTKVTEPVYHGRTRGFRTGDFNTKRGFKGYYDETGGVDSTGYILPPNRAYPGDLGAWFSSTGKGTDTFAGARTGVSGGQVHQSYINLQSPKIFKTHGDFIDWFHSQTAKGESASKARRSLIKDGHDGIVIEESMTDGGGLRSDYVVFDSNNIKNAISPQMNSGMGKNQRGGIDIEALFGKRKQFPSPDSLTISPSRIVPEDTIETPRSVITLQQKQNLEQKARAVGLKDTPYTRVTTPEEVVASLQDPNDIPPSYTGSRNKLISGSEGMVRLYPKNKLLNFVRSSFQEARNTHESWSKEYLTGDTGINTLLTKLSLDEKSDVVGLLLALDRKQHPLTDSIMSTAGFTPDQIALAKRIRETDDFLYQQKALSLGEQGFDPHPYRQGHIPANFSGAYRALVGHMVNGEFKVTGIAQADTAYGLKQALGYYKKQGDKYSVVVGKERVGLRSATIRGKNAEAWATLVEQLAKHDPEFAKVKAAADQAGADAAASLYDFHLHEKTKKGVKGSLGDRPWLDRDTNTKQFIEGLIDYFEDGFRYTAYQKPLNETTQLLTNPEVQSKIPNASKYVQQYVNHIKGENLHTVGAALNWGVDTLARSMTLGNTKIQKINHELTHWSSIHMMGGLNLGFYLMQLTQVATGGLPEYAALRQSLQADPNEFVSSVTNTASVFRALGAEMLSGKQVEIPGHMRVAYDWAHKHGLFTFSEAELAHQVLQSKTRKTVDAYLTAPIKYGELTTRPVIFMMYADLLHQRGFTGEEGLKIAQNATDFAMANYHPDERPMLYQSLGTLGGLLGALTTYKHNVFTQNVTRAKNVFKQPAAAALAVATGYALYGMGGFPGAQEASQLSELLTGKTLREQLLSDPRETSGWYDGLLTASTGIDFQSRLAMSSALPDSALSAFPHISNIFSVTDKALQFALNPNQGSFQDLATTVTPSGMRGIPEKIFSPDGDMLTKEGMSKYDENRTPEEMKRRIIFGLRPFRERLTDERNYANRIKEAKRMKKLSEAQSRFDRAFLLGDAEGQDRAYGDYLENDGNPDTLWNTTRLQELKKKSVQSEEARRAGTPKNISTLKKYETFTE